MKKTLLAAALAMVFTDAYAQQSVPILSTPVTTMGPNRRIYVNNQWPAKNSETTGRSAVSLHESTVPSDVPSRWPGFAFGTVGRNVGGFRIFSHWSHGSEDDPIIYPGQGGRSHCHMFFGNTDTRGVSTPTSIRTTGNSTSAGGTANRSAYWVPCMVYVCDSLAKITAGCNFARNGEVIYPRTTAGNNVYYKSHWGEELDTTGKPAGYWTFNHDTEVFPIGFRMIAGTSTATENSPAGNDGGNGYTCSDAADNETSLVKTIPGTGGTASCNSLGLPGAAIELKYIVRFPACWNGVDLDSPTHNTHVIFQSRTSDASYTMLDVEDWFCPAAYPHVLPGVTYKVHYAYTTDADVKWWRLSSDNYDTSQPAGRSMHGDWFNGWDVNIMAEWVANCMVKGVDCHDNVLGPGISNPSAFRVLDPPIGMR